MDKPDITPAALARMIDHAVLKPEATPAEVRAACELAARHNLACLCVKGCDVPQARALLEPGGVAVGTVVSFPHGGAATSAKVAEARQAVADGADELDMVLNIGRLRSGDLKYVRSDIAAVVEAAAGRTVKVILECCWLDRRDMSAACRAAADAGANFVKTSTGFGASGATADDVRFLRKEAPRRMGVKAAGGIKTLADAVAMIQAGADRIGTSNTENILAELK